MGFQAHFLFLFGPIAHQSDGRTPNKLFSHWNLAGVESKLCIYYWPRSRWLDIGRVLFLRFYGPRRNRGPWKCKKRTRPISSHLDRTSLVNKWSSFLFIFEHWKGTQLNAKVIARASISWLDKCRKYNHLIGYISNFQIQNKLLCLTCRFLLQNVFLKLSNIFVFFVFILVDAFSGSIKTEKSHKFFLP